MYRPEGDPPRRKRACRPGPRRTPGDRAPSRPHQKSRLQEGPTNPTKEKSRLTNSAHPGEEPTSKKSRPTTTDQGRPGPAGRTPPAVGRSTSTDLPTSPPDEAHHPHTKNGPTDGRPETGNPAPATRTPRLVPARPNTTKRATTHTTKTDQRQATPRRATPHLHHEPAAAQTRARPTEPHQDDHRPETEGQPD
jgi:hypothetical protein